MTPPRSGTAQLCPVPGLSERLLTDSGHRGWRLVARFEFRLWDVTDWRQQPPVVEQSGSEGGDLVRSVMRR